MPRLVPNKPIEQSSPQLAVSNKLPVGKHRFELVVIDDAGQASTPQRVTVVVLKATQPAVIRRIDPTRLRDRINPPIWR